jgi:hypothetical protein
MDGSVAHTGVWTQFCPYTNQQQFLTEIRQEKNFYQRLWELHLGCTLIQQKYHLQNVGNKGGPDLLINFNHKKIWIEAIAPSVGTGKDTVPSIQWNSVEAHGISWASEIPEEKIILRFTAAIKEKWRKYKRYLEKGIIQDGVGRNLGEHNVWNPIGFAFHTASVASSIQSA